VYVSVDSIYIILDTDSASTRDWLIWWVIQQ